MLNRIFKLVAVFSLLASSMLAAQELRTTEYQDWVGICGEIQGQERCEIQQTLFMQGEEGDSKLLEANLSLVDGQMVMQLLLPLGIDLRPGIAMQIDQGEEFGADVFSCFHEGCIVAFPVDDARLAAMRAGTTFKVGFRPFNSAEVMVLEVSLMGFTNASRSIK